MHPVNDIVQLEESYGAHNYAPLPVVLSRAEGVYTWDLNGKKYIDMMSAYSAVSLGHKHPRIIAALVQQANTLDVISRAYYSDQLGPFLVRLCELTGLDKALPMNTGSEAVETAMKVARKWAYKCKGVAPDKAEIIACNGNFHGRTISIVGMSSEEQYKDGFGPFPEGLKRIPFGDADALANAITPNTAAFLVEPIQGEGGINIPPDGYLSACMDLCKQHNVLMICDEVQTGLGRTGKWFAFQHENIVPDGLILGKALGGGVYPVSVFLANDNVMSVITPGDHGSTFGGNPIAAAVGMEALNVLEEENLIDQSRLLGEYFINTLQQAKLKGVKQIRGRGLFIGLEIDPEYATARDICLKLLHAGLLSKETHDTVVRLAPPLVITRTQINQVVDILKNVMQ